MSEEPVTKWWAVGSEDIVVARKYLSYLHKHSMFGGHVGLNKRIRNDNPNRSLDSSRGMYDMLEVYTLSGTSCEVGTVVNFKIDDDNNVEGDTYVYPCTDITKPMGYMVTEADPDVYGICVVNGILEVPLNYEKGATLSESDYKDYVEYDIETGTFNFADSGYPVYNVYQDVDGDWIAIILFGNIKSDCEYDGPFAVSVSGVTGSTTFVDVLGGDVFFNDVRDVCEDLTTSIGMSTGESLWLSTAIVGNTHSYSFISQSTAPIDGSTVFYTKIAENNDGEIRQIHYGDIRYSRTKLISGSTNVHLYPANGLGDVIISVDGGTGGGCVVQNIIATVSGSTANLGLTDTSVVAKLIPKGNVFIEAGGTNEIIIGSTVTGSTGTVTGITHFVGLGNTATISTIGGSGNVKFIGDGVDISGTTSGEIELKVSGSTSSSFNYTGSFKVDCWDTEDGGVVHNVRIYDSNNRDDMVGYAGWVHIGNQKYHVPDYNNTFSDGDVIYLIGTFNESNELSSFEFRKIQTFFPTINDNQFCVRICYATNGKMYQTQYGDIVQPARYVGDGETTEIHNNIISAITGGTGVTQGLYSAIRGGTPAICITGSSTYVPIAGGTNTYTLRDSSGAIIVGSTASGGGSGSYNNQYIYTQPNEASAVSVDDAVINISPNTRVFFAVYHNLREISGTKYYRYYWTGDEPSGQYKRTRHLTNYSNPDYDGGAGYGSEMHLTAPSENCSVIIDVFYESTCIVSAEHTIILQNGLRIEPTDFVPLYENNTYVFTFVSGATSFWYVHGIG